MIHNLRLPARPDYIKLPCLTRSDYENYDVKYLGTEIGETIRLRSDLILSAVANFKPDLFLIDKKPYGVKNELMMALNYARLHLPESRRMLVLRDILDSPQRTIRAWRKNGYDDARADARERLRRFARALRRASRPERRARIEARRKPDGCSFGLM